MKPQNGQQSLFPDIPEEIRSARIGTCFNSITRKLMYLKIAIDPNRLKNGAVQFVSGKGILKLKANSSTDTASESTFFSVDSKIKMDIIGCSASIGFKVSTASSSATNNQSLNCYCSYVYSGQKLQLLDIGPHDLFNCMSDEFQKAYTEIVQSTDLKEYLAKYMHFVSLFGHGCVTELYLTSGSAFMMTAKYTDQSVASKYKFGGSVCISSPWGNGGSVASEYAKDMAKAKSDASMELIGEQLPQDTPTKEWCGSLMTSVFQAGFELLAKKPEIIKPYEGPGPVAPDIPKGEPSKKEEPKGDALDISDELKQKIMDEDDFSGTWEEYEKAQKKAYEEMEETKLEGEIKGILLDAGNKPGKQIITKGEKVTPKNYSNNIGVGDTWDLGGYVPYT